MNDGSEEQDSEPTGHTGEIERTIREIRSRRRSRVNWKVSKHTAEMAIGAIGTSRERTRPVHGKSRRRKKHKRLL